MAVARADAHPGLLRGSIRAGFAQALRFTEELPAYRHGALAEFRAFVRDAGPEGFTGDPAAVARAVYDVGRQDRPPLRMPLGGDAFHAVTAALRERLRAIEPREELARSIAFGADPA
ncbi:hypothetical protein AB0K15_15535 [Amycolatopsis sp. NPDC049253]|uniref:hypothetical protein n=1 Tax=Amycolatopsis sp. NPDC049253 TaxID=3155274 RepID=UPI00342B2ACB